MPERVDAGGRAGAGGFDYQHRCGAWLSAHILAGTGAAPTLSLWSGALARLDCETGDPVDDCRVTPNVGEPFSLQCKRTLNLSPASESELAKTAAQFVDHHRLAGHGAQDLVLATTSQASGNVRVALRAVLDVIRKADEAATLGDLQLNQDERRAIEIFSGHLTAAWETRTGTAPTEGELRTLLRRCHVLVLDVEPGGSDETAARQLLRTVVVAEPNLADSAWDSLVELCARLAAERSGVDRQRLQGHLLARGISLQTVVDFRPDLERLDAATNAALDSLEAGLLTIPAPDTEIELHRQSVDAVVTRSLNGSVLLVGDPGIGKTVALRHVVRVARELGSAVVFFAVGSTSATSLGGLRNELGLDHELADVLAEWAPGTRKLLVIDALDAARSESQADLWRKLIDLTRARLPEWNVVASVRTWDLKHSPRLRAQFPGTPAMLGDLQDDELAQVASVWPELEALVQSASDEVRQLLRIPFNLRLASDLLLGGISVEDLRELDSQLELFDRYWTYRVTDGVGGLPRQALVTRACDAALQNRTLTVATDELLRSDANAGDVLAVLLSRSVLAQAMALPGFPGVPAVCFSHHVLFDYAVAATTFAASSVALTQRLRDDPDLVVFARPSVDMYLERLWRAGPNAFWETAVSIASDDQLPRLATVAVAEVAARRAGSLDELEPLLVPILNGTGSQAHDRLLRYVVIAVVIDRQDAVEPCAGVWPQVVERLSENVPATEGPLRILLDDLLMVRGRQ